MEIELAQGKTYSIEKYPKNERVKGRYLGETEGMHFFEAGRPLEKEYVVVEDKWAVFIDGVLVSHVTHRGYSSCPIITIPKHEISKLQDKRLKSGLLKMLNGEQK